MMPMFSFDKSSYEAKILDLLQSGFFLVARRNKILAKWAGGRLGYKDAVLEAYVRSVILSYLVTPSDRKIVNRILTDFRSANIKMTEEKIIEKMRSIDSRIKAKRGVKQNAS
jgi:hypothetical protein